MQNAQTKKSFSELKGMFGRAAINQDGVDHIWVSPVSHTDIGRISSPGWKTLFFIPGIGEFSSPTCFVTWLFTGDDAARHDHRVKAPFIPREDGSRKFANAALMLAKYHQLCKLAPRIKTPAVEKLVLLPWVEYKVHVSGLKEQFPGGRAKMLRDMVEHIITKGQKTPLPTEIGFDYDETMVKIQEMIKATFGLTDADAMAPAIAGKKKHKKEQPESVEPADEAVTQESGETANETVTQESGETANETVTNVGTDQSQQEQQAA